MAPVTMRAASFWIFSNSSDSYWVQLSQTTFAYSRRGLMNEIYIESNYLTITVYHTTRDITVLFCIQQPPFNNIHLSTILPETQLYLSAFSNHLTITSTCQPYHQTQLIGLSAYSNYLTITSTCLPFYQKYDCTYLPTATTFINLASLPFKRIFFWMAMFHVLWSVYF